MYNKNASGRHSHNGKDKIWRENLEEVKDSVAQTREAISKTAHHAKDRAEDFLHDSWWDMRDKSRDLKDEVATYVKENPMRAVGFAVLAGVILSQLLRK